MLLAIPEDEDGLAFRLTLLTLLGFLVVSKLLVQKCLGESVLYREREDALASFFSTRAVGPHLAI